MIPLYLDEPVKSKTAGFVARLSDEPNNWPQEVTSEIYKQLPYLSDYEVHVEIERVDPQRGFGHGYADVSNVTERPEVEHDETGLPHIRIPIVIEERALKSMATFLNGEEVLPLNEDRIREALFQPATFDLSTQEPKDPSLVNDIMPPQRAGMGAGEVKVASATSAQANAAKERFEKTAFAHISKPQWEALHKNPKVQQLVEKHGTHQHPEVQNQVYELAAQVYGYHPKNGGYAPSNPSHPQNQKKVQQAMGQGQTKTAKVHPVMGRVYDGAIAAGKKVKEVAKDHGGKALALGAVGGTAYLGGRAGAKSGTKQASARPSLLLAIAPTVHQADVDLFAEKVASDQSLIAGFRRNGIAPVLVKFAGVKRASAKDHLLALAERVEPNVVTLQKLPGGEFLVKSANTDAFAGGPAAAGEVVPEAEAAEAIGPENAQAMMPGQTVTVNANPIQSPADGKPPKAKVVEEFGQFKVQDMMGNSLIGHVFPRSLAWDGEFSEQPIAVFTNGSAYAVQDSIAGEIVGKGTVLPSDSPRGDGVFYSVRDGEGVCTSPVTIGSSMAGPDGQPKFLATDLMGNQLQISFMDGLKTPQRITDVEYALPSDWKFMRLNNQTQLVPDPMQMGKTAAVRSARSEAVLFFNGAFHLEGGCGLDKIASSLRYDMDPVHAEFMLAILGLDGVAAKQKVAEARRKGEVKLAGLKTITTLGERYEGAVKTASALLAQLPKLKVDLIKEASTLEDTGTVDNVLALNFLNAENLPTFVSYIPELETTSMKLAEMLLSAQLGQKELPEEEIDRAMKNLEAVIQGLKAIAHAEA